MKISYKAEYVLKIMLDLTENYPESLAHVDEIAKRQQIPRKYLEQILLFLKKGGFLESKKGPLGGYALSRPPKEITLGEVIRFVEGPFLSFSSANFATGRQASLIRGVFTEIWQEMNEAMSQVLDRYSFEDLKQHVSRLCEKQTLTYHI
ncbi:MAG TPA: Rrf2 family transcriptional regulator [Candidatus Omnitrophota bacterium]|nr:Rrf2 family transcriptional regulator [Candidatus Omnitrophota bacterium]